jgi:hypothetical protein
MRRWKSSIVAPCGHTVEEGAMLVLVQVYGGILWLSERALIAFCLLFFAGSNVIDGDVNQENTKEA